MTDSLHHRGPDDSGLFIDGSIGLGNRRLAIVDISSAGHQPMASASGQSWISYNGEFYNHQDYRSTLKAKGCDFRGSSDTETLLELLATYGPDCLSQVAGIFAFAYWDNRHRRLILARDPMGVKQLYYHDNGRRVVFASEIKALFQNHEVPREADQEAINQYVHFHTALFDRTFFKGIRQVMAGEYVEVTDHGISRKVYWQTDGFQPRSETPEASVAELRHLLDKVVHEQLMGDVPVGAFFSGGIDSSAVSAFAKRAGRPPQCFGIHFSGQDVVDERPYQEAAAKALGLDLKLTTLSGRSFPEDLLRLTYFQDEPVIGPAMIPMYYVSRLASQSVKVCLGGQAADEVFGGYARYALAHPARALSSLFSPGERIPHDQDGTSARVGGNLLKQLADWQNIRRVARRMRPYEGWARRYFENFLKVPERSWRKVFPDRAVLSRRRAWQTFDEVLKRSPAKDPGDKLLHWDMQTYLPGLFQQDDRMSMACSLESRVPLADPRIVRFALHTSFDLKLRSGATKWILRQAVADVIPAMVLNRRKVGFDTPAEAWMRTEHSGFIRDLLLSERARTRGFWNPKGIEQLLNAPSSQHWFDIVWKLSSIEAWARVFLDGPPPVNHVVTDP